MMIKLKKEGYFLDMETLDILYVKDNVILSRQKIPFPEEEEYESWSDEEEEIPFNEYKEYGENNPPLPFTPVGDKEYDV